jgi:dephospho-CoA kinase
MIVIGVAGGVGSGKSMVSQRLGALGAAVLEADRVGHDVLREPEVKGAIRRRWGEGVFGPDGEVDRRRVASIVFAPPPEGPPELIYLEQLTHPRIGEHLRRSVDRIARQRQHPVLVLDAALLIEAGWDVLCDKILFVEAPRAVRLARARQRGWTRAEFEAREAAQAPLDHKRARADIVIDNSSTPEYTSRQLEPVWHRLTSDPCGGSDVP